MNYNVKVFLEFLFWLAMLGISGVLIGYSWAEAVLCVLLGGLLFVAWQFFPRSSSK